MLFLFVCVCVCLWSRGSGCACACACACAFARKAIYQSDQEFNFQCETGKDISLCIQCAVGSECGIQRKTLAQ